MTLRLQYLVGIPGSILLRFPIDGTYGRKRSGSRSLGFRLVVFLPTAVPLVAARSNPLCARCDSTRRHVARRGATAWLGVARRGATPWLGVARRSSARLDARCGARRRLSRGLELLEQRSAGATRHVSTIEHGRNEAITRAHIYIYPVARKRGDSVRARASERERGRRVKRKRETERGGDGKRKRDRYRKREKARDWRQAGRKSEAARGVDSTSGRFRAVRASRISGKPR